MCAPRHLGLRVVDSTRARFCAFEMTSVIAGWRIYMDRRPEPPLPTLLPLLLCSFLAVLLLSQRSIVVDADLVLLSTGVERYTSCRELMRKPKVEALTSAHGKPGSRPPQCHDECKDCHGECAASPVYLDRSKARGHAVWTCVCLL